MTTFIAVASGKGGVGKTTTAINLGCALTNFGYDVVVVDTNLATPHIGLHLGSPRLEHTINDALTGAKNIRETAFSHPSGLRIIGADISRSSDTKQYRKIGSVLADLDGTCDIIILDSPAGAWKETSQIFKSAHDVVVVTTPDLPAVSDALKTIVLAEDSGVNVVGVIINQSTGDKSEMTKRNIEKMLEKSVLGVVPQDIHARRALSLKQPVVFAYPNSPSAVGFLRCAAFMMGIPYEEKMPKPQQLKEREAGLAQLLNKLKSLISP